MRDRTTVFKSPMQKLFAVGMAFGLGLALSVTPSLATEFSSTSSSAANEMEEAAAFFSKLAESSQNPYISAMANRNLKSLNTTNTATVSTEKPTQDASISSARHIDVPFISQASGGLAVLAMLNNNKMGTFLLDTGATHTVITPRMAKKLGVVVTKDTPRISIVTANGVVRAPMVKVKSLTLGSATIHNVDVVIKDLGNDILLSGLIGMNTFKDMELTVKRNRLVLHIP